MVVGQRGPEDGLVLLLELGHRVRLHPQPALLPHHVALRVELPEHQVGEAVRLHPAPQLELVGGHRHEEGGHVGVGERVDHRGAIGGVDLVELVLDDELVLVVLELLHLGAQLGQARGLVLGVVHAARDLAPPLGPAQLLVLLLHGAEDAVQAVQDLLLLGIVRRADGPGALEHHVLEEVGDAGDAGPLVGAAHAGHPPGGDGGGVVALHHEQPQAVGQGHLLDRDVGLLGGQGEGDGQQQDDQPAPTCDVSDHGTLLVAACTRRGRRWVTV